MIFEVLNGLNGRKVLQKMHSTGSIFHTARAGLASKTPSSTILKSATSAMTDDVNMAIEKEPLTKKDLERRLDVKKVKAAARNLDYRPTRTRILVLGSGWAGFNFLKDIDKTRYDVRVVSPSNHFLFTPLLPSSAVGTLEFRVIQEPIRKIKGLEAYYQAKAVGVDWENRKLVCDDIFVEDEFELDFDYLLLGTGQKTNTFNTPGIQEREGREVFFLKHLYHARQIRNRILEVFERAELHLADSKERDRLLSFVVVGGGPTSCEFVGELHDFVTQDVARFYPHLKKHINVTLVEASEHLLGQFDQKLVGYVEKRFKSRNINVRLNTAVVKFDEKNGRFAELSDGEKLPVGMLVWSAGLKQVKFIESLEELNKGNTSRRVLIDDRLRVDTPEVTRGRAFAFGDCAINLKYPTAPLAQVARAQGKYLAKAFNNAPDSRESFPSEVLADKPFKFINMGSMATLGGWKGVIDFSQVGEITKPKKFGTATGLLAFVVWRSAYLGRQVSLENMVFIPLYWMKSLLFGRDISRF